ncbi:MAG TPA: hypothetical protein VMI10_20395 [Terriglobales bacterium]|nr:hypothetical protein [Terriglobales bacterium]
MTQSPHSDFPVREAGSLDREFRVAHGMEARLNKEVRFSERENKIPCLRFQVSRRISDRVCGRVPVAAGLEMSDR